MSPAPAAGAEQVERVGLDPQHHAPRLSGVRSPPPPE